MTLRCNSAISRRGAPEFCVKSSPSKNSRAQGKPGAHCTRSPCAKGRKHTVVTTGTPDTRPSLRDGFTAYSALSLVTGLSCHHRLRDTSRKLERQRRGVRTTRLCRRCSAARPHAIGAATPPRPSHPKPYVRDDRETPLARERDGGDMDLIWEKGEADYFSDGDWTGRNRLIRFRKSGITRRRFRAIGPSAIVTHPVLFPEQRVIRRRATRFRRRRWHRRRA